MLTAPQVERESVILRNVMLDLRTKLRQTNVKVSDVISGLIRQHNLATSYDEASLQINHCGYSGTNADKEKTEMATMCLTQRSDSHKMKL